MMQINYLKYILVNYLFFFIFKSFNNMTFLQVLSKLNYLTNQIDNLAVMLRLINFLGNFGAIKLNAECSNILAKIFGELLSHPKSGKHRY